MTKTTAELNTNPIIAITLIFQLVSIIITIMICRWLIKEINEIRMREAQMSVWIIMLFALQISICCMLVVSFI